MTPPIIRLDRGISGEDFRNDSWWKRQRGASAGGRARAAQTRPSMAEYGRRGARVTRNRSRARKDATR